MKVLIIDDEDDIRRIARLSLVKIGGLPVVEAASGPEGVRNAADERPDAILLDVMLPAMDGPQTLAARRAQPATVVIPVVFLTAKAMASELAHLTALGAVGTLTKPLDPVTLPAQLKEAVARG
jgi:CheY-like chemotaxis protein